MHFNNEFLVRFPIGDVVSCIMNRFRQMRGNTQAAEMAGRFETMRNQNATNESILDVVHEHGTYSWVSDCF